MLISHPGGYLVFENAYYIGWIAETSRSHGMRGVPLTGGKFETSFSSLPLFISSALIPGQSNQIPAGAHNRLLIGFCRLLNCLEADRTTGFPLPGGESHPA